MENTETQGAPDTTAIAANALSTLEAQSSPTPEATPSPAATPLPGATPAAAAPAATPPAATAAAKELSAELKWLQEQGHRTHKSDGRANWLPVATVERMLNQYLETHKGEWTKERTGWQSERQQLAAAAQAAHNFRRLMEQDPRALLQRMAQMDPRYQQFLVEQRREERQQLPPQEEDPEPQPDLDLGNGRASYSLDGIRKLRAWERRQMERAFDERMAPLLQRARDEEQRVQVARVEQMLQHRTQNVLTRAKQWPKWSEHEAEITKVLQEDSRQAEANGTEPQLSVHDAYMQVVGPVLTGNYNSIREQALRDLNGAARSTSVTATGAEPVRKPGALTVEDITRRAYHRLEGNGR